jgi:hypothetical protein
MLLHVDHQPEPSADSDLPAAHHATGFSRRALLTGAAAVALGGVLVGEPGAAERLRAELRADDVPHITGRPQPVYSFSVERDSDLLALDMAFHGFTKTLTDKVTTLVPDASNVIVVQFPPQAIGEAAYPLTKPDWSVDPPPVLSAMSGPSRLCFRTGEPIAFATQTVVDLLDWSAWTLLVPGPAHINGKVGHGERRGATGGVVSSPADPRPGGLTTYIEYPYAMFLAPTVDATATATSGYTTTFAGRPTNTPLTSPAGVTDCWTVALHQNEASGAARTAELAAVWARDYKSGDATAPTDISYKT